MSKISWKCFFILSIFAIIVTIQFFLPLSLQYQSRYTENVFETNKPPKVSPIYSSHPNKHVKSSASQLASSLNISISCKYIPKEAIHAINRAKTLQCKQDIADIACLAKQGKLYPYKMPNLCPSKEFIANEAIMHTTYPDRQTVRIAFLLAFNGRSVRQMIRLIRKIYHEKHIYFIHVDQRQNYLFAQLTSLEKFSNIYLTRNRFATIWGGASLLEMLLNSFKELLKLFEWDYVINLSESDFPIKSLKRLEDFLTVNSGYNFVKSHGQDTEKFLIKQGLDRTFYQCDDHMWKLGSRKIPEGIIIDGGSDWVALTRKFTEYLVTSNDDLISGIKSFFKYTLLPAESFFHTALRNSHFCSKIINNNLHLTNWRRKQGCKCQYKHIVDWCGCSPNDLKINDWPKILDTVDKPLFFARKFEPVIDQAIINKIDLFISKSKSRSTQYNLDKYWQNDYHHTFDLLDDEKRSYYTILSIMGLMKLANTCSNHLDSEQTFDDNILNHIETKEATLFFEKDVYQGTIIQASILRSDNKTKSYFEFFAHPFTYFQTINSKVDFKVSAKIGTDYDMKEQVFRNFGSIFHPFSRIAVEHTWKSHVSQNITATFVWIDPTETVAGSFDIRINLNNSSADELNEVVYVHKPSFTLPLRPGVWKLLIFYQWTLFTENRFLILPFIFWKGNPVNADYVMQLNNGPLSGKYYDHNFSSVESLLKLRRNPQLDLLSTQNASKLGSQLIKWCISLVIDFWTIHDMCKISSLSFSSSSFLTKQCDFFISKTCNTTSWSSTFPDLKATLS